MAQIQLKGCNFIIRDFIIFWQGNSVIYLYMDYHELYEHERKIN